VFVVHGQGVLAPVTGSAWPLSTMAIAIII